METALNTEGIMNCKDWGRAREIILEEEGFERSTGIYQPKRGLED